LLLLLYNQQWIDPSNSPQNPMTSMEKKKRRRKTKGLQSNFIGDTVLQILNINPSNYIRNKIIVIEIVL